jgi:hypothetical protein
MLEGYKTYILGVLTVVFAILFGLGYLDQAAFIAVLGILGGGGLITVRKAIAGKK